MKDVSLIEQEAKEVIKAIKGANGYVEKVKVVENGRNTPKPKKVFPKTPSMLPNRYNLGETSKHYPLVRDEKGKIVIAGTRYSSRRQHYPVDEVNNA